MHPLSAFSVCVLSALKKNLMTVFQAHNGAVVVLQQCRNCNKSPHLVLSPSEMLQITANPKPRRSQEAREAERAGFWLLHVAGNTAKLFFIGSHVGEEGERGVLWEPLHVRNYDIDRFWIVLIKHCGFAAPSFHFKSKRILGPRAIRIKTL